MSYTIQYEKRALKELSKLSATVVKQILAKIESLSIDPFQSGIKKLKGFDNVFGQRQVIIGYFMKLRMPSCSS